MLNINIKYSKYQNIINAFIFDLVFFLDWRVVCVMRVKHVGLTDKHGTKYKAKSHINEENKLY